jgi:hypothetical protein
MTTPRVTDNDCGNITVSLDDRELRGWSYKTDAERRQKMLQAREYIEGWCDARAATRHSLYIILNDCLCDMKPNHDDSVTGFNEAWDLMRKFFQEDRAEDLVE